MGGHRIEGGNFDDGLIAGCLLAASVSMCLVRLIFTLQNADQGSLSSRVIHIANEIYT